MPQLAPYDAVGGRRALEVVAPFGSALEDEISERRQEGHGRERRRQHERRLPALVVEGRVPRSVTCRRRRSRRGRC